MNEEKYSICYYTTESGNPGIIKVETRKVLICIFLWEDNLETLPRPVSGFSFLYKLKDFKENKGLIVVKNPVMNYSKCKYFENLKDFNDSYIEVRDQIKNAPHHNLIYEGYRNEEGTPTSL